MKTADRYRTFEEFWPYYVKEHQKKATRLLHFAGTTAAMGCLAGAAVFKSRWLLLAAPVVGYGPAWVGHLFVEKNRPASFSHPLWSLRADLVMWTKMLRGGMDAEVERVLAEDAERAAAVRAAESEAPASGERRPATGDAFN